MSNARVEALIQDIRMTNENNYAIVQVVRQLVLAVGNDVAEEVKYGGILFSTGKAFCGVFAYTGHVTVEFGDGASLPDKFGMLEGQGKQRQHIKLLAQDDVKSKHLKHYVTLARKQLDA